MKRIKLGTKEFDTEHVEVNGGTGYNLPILIRIVEPTWPGVTLFRCEIKSTQEAISTSSLHVVCVERRSCS
jgi:hypothetical protein